MGGKGRGKGGGKGKGQAAEKEVEMDYSGLETGMKVQAEAEGTYYAAEVLQVSFKKPKTPVKVRFVGYTAASDEWLGADRLRSKALVPKEGGGKGKVSPELLCKLMCAGLRFDRDLADPDQPGQIRKMAEAIIASGVDPADLKKLTFKKSKEYSVLFLTAILAAESALKLKKCPKHHHTIIHAMYGEQDRMKAFEPGSDGQDFVRVKVESMNWLYGKYAAKGSTWNYVAVDDGCPNNPPSGKLMEEVIKKEGYTNVEVVYLQTGIDEKTPPFDQLKTTKDSRKGGSILYGLHHVAKTSEKVAGGNKHIASFYDADLSADLSLIGLLAHPILKEGKKCGVGQRYGCQGSFLALPEGANGHPQMIYKNTDCFRMMFRHFARGILMPSLKGIYDTQCAFKSIEVDKLGEIVSKINEFGPGFDMELLIVTGQTFEKNPFKLVPFLFIEDKEGSTMSSTDEAASKSFHTMLKAMCKIHDRCFADATLTEEEKGWIQLFRDIDLQQYCKMIAANKEKLGPEPEKALDTTYDLAEAKKNAGM